MELGCFWEVMIVSSNAKIHAANYSPHKVSRWYLCPVQVTPARVVYRERRDRSDELGCVNYVRILVIMFQLSFLNPLSPPSPEPLILIIRISLSPPLPPSLPLKSVESPPP